MTDMYPGINKARYLYKYRYWPVLQNILKMKISFRVIIGRLYIYEGPPPRAIYTVFHTEI